MKKLVVFAFVLLALPVAAADFERVLLPIAPSTVMCGYHSRFETKLVVFNQADRLADDLAPMTGREVSGPQVMTPLPAYRYIPKADAEALQMRLRIESSDQEKLDERFFIDLPIVRESEFRTGKMQIYGVRVDPGFRQTLRIYGLDGHAATQVMMRAYPMDSNVLIREEPYWLYPEGDWVDSEGRMAGPSFTMECDLSKDWELIGRQVRVEVEPMDPNARIWAFVSVTNNKTQSFYTVMPK
jgi:hypothetical protein